MTSLFGFKSLNKRGGSGNVPRELYVFGIIIGYIVFGFFYVASVNTYTSLGYNTDCVVEHSGFTQIGVGDGANSLFSNLVTNIVCAPAWLNIIIGAITILAITMILIMVLHG